MQSHTQNFTICNCLAYNPHFVYAVTISDLRTTPLPPGPPPSPLPPSENVQDSSTNIRNESRIDRDDIVLIVVIPGVFVLTVIALALFIYSTRNMRKQNIKVEQQPELSPQKSDENKLDEISDFSAEEELREYSISSLEEMTASEGESQDYSIGVDDLDEGETKPVHTLITGNRLSRLGLNNKDEPIKQYVSTSTQRSSFQTEYDLDAPSIQQSTKPVASTRTARASKQGHSSPSTTTAKYSATSTRITSAYGRESKSKPT